MSDETKNWRPKASQNEVLRCSFCNKSQRDVRKLIAGPLAYICNECVGICNKILDEEKISTSKSLLVPAKRNFSAVEDEIAATKSLINEGNLRSAVRSIRRGSLAAARALVELNGSETYGFGEPSLLTTLMEIHPFTVPLLHEKDSGHIILRVVVDAASVRASEIKNALEVLCEIAAHLKEQIEKAEREEPEGRP